MHFYLGGGVLFFFQPIMVWWSLEAVCYGLGVVMPGNSREMRFRSLGLLFRNHTGPPQPFLKSCQHIAKASSLIHRLHPERDGFCASVHKDQARGDSTGTIYVKKQSNRCRVVVGGCILKPSCSRETTLLQASPDFHMALFKCLLSEDFYASNWCFHRTQTQHPYAPSVPLYCVWLSCLLCHALNIYEEIIPHWNFSVIIWV